MPGRLRGHAITAWVGQHAKGHGQGYKCKGCVLRKTEAILKRYDVGVDEITFEWQRFTGRFCERVDIAEN
jgi:hypothetical protein